MDLTCGAHQFYLQCSNVQGKVSHPDVLSVCPDPLLKAKVDNTPPAQSICTTVPFQIISQVLAAFDHNFCII